MPVAITMGRAILKQSWALSAIVSEGISLNRTPSKRRSVTNTQPPSTATATAGTLELVRFANPSGLDASMGRNLLLETEASGDPVTSEPGIDGIGTLAQGFLENSNVQTVEEIINMIIAQRAYEANSKVIQTADEMLQIANNVRR